MIDNNSNQEIHTEELPATSATALLPSPPVRLALGTGLCALLILGFSFFDGQPTPAPLPVAEVSAPLPSSFFTDITLEATSAYVLDLATGDVLYEKQAETQLPLASLTKLMSALVIASNVSLDRTVAITDDALAIEGDSGFTAGQRWNVDTLLDYTLMTSSNDGIHALAEATPLEESFTSAMNQQAAAIGMTQTYFVNDTGLDASTSLSGSYGSAKDVASLVAHVIAAKPHLLEVTRYSELTFSSLDGKTFDATNTNDAIDDIPGLVASKTGYTDLAGGNLAVVFDAGLRHPIVAVVLGSSFDGRFSDMKTLVDRTTQAFAVVSEKNSPLPTTD